MTPTHGYIDISQRRDIWRKASEKYNGNFSIGHNSGNEIEILRMKIPYKKCLIEISESDTRPLKFQTELSFTQRFSFNISWEDSIEKFFKLFGKQDIIIGEEMFDDKFLIQSDNPDLLKRILSDSEIKRLVIKHNIYSLICNYDKQKENHKLLCVANRKTDTLETLNELIDLQILLIDKFKDDELKGQSAAVANANSWFSNV